jgi:hypothetical protein
MTVKPASSSIAHLNLYDYRFNTITYKNVSLGIFVFTALIELATVILL